MAKKKRTLSPEHLQKMQEGRKRAKLRKKRLEILKEKGLVFPVEKSKYEKMIDKMKRK